MFNFLNRFAFFKKYFQKQKDDSSKIAKDRLQLVLIHERAAIPPQLMNILRYELIKIISRYMVINEDKIVMGLDKKDGTVILAANIPILKIKPDSEPTQKEETPAETTSKPKMLPSKPKTLRKVRRRYTSYRLARRRPISRKRKK